MSFRKGKLSNKEYDFIFSRVPRLTVDVVIKDRRGVLLSLRDIEPAKHQWHIPGGRVYAGELLARAAKRIAREETGLIIKVERILGAIEFPREINHRNKLVHTVSVAVLAVPVGGRLAGSWQGRKLRFFKSLPRPVHKIQGLFLKAHKVLAG